MTTAPKRTFTTPRLKSFAGYTAPPVLMDGLSYFLPPFSVITTRLVTFGVRLFEIWSPNSSQTVYYPGVSAPNAPGGMGLPEHLRRCDGTLGRFDPTLSPQYFNPQYPFLPFIRRHVNDDRPEHRPFLSVWQPHPSPTSPNNGFVLPTFVDALVHRVNQLQDAAKLGQPLEWYQRDLWGRRQESPVAADFNVLRYQMSFDNAVDAFVKLQRGLKVLSVWVRLADIAIKSHGCEIDMTTVPLADDNLVGVWLNGTLEKDGLWLLRLGVPCFIIHEVDGGLDLERVVNQPRLWPTFWKDTPVSKLLDTVHPMDLAVVSDGGNLRDLDEDLGQPSEAPIADAVSRSRSSPAVQGFSHGRYVGPCVDRISNKLPHVEVGGWVIPPEVMPVSAGKWSHWCEETTDSGELHLLRVGKSTSKDRGRYTYYDRQRLRVLHVDDRILPSAHYNADPLVFGLPAPRVRYLEEFGHGRYHEHNLSHWVYQVKDPNRSDVGRKFVPDPLMGAPATLPVPVQGPITNIMDDNEDTVSLGGASDDGYWPARKSSPRPPSPAREPTICQPSVVRGSSPCQPLPAREFPCQRRPARQPSLCQPSPGREPSPSRLPSPTKPRPPSPSRDQPSYRSPQSTLPPYSGRHSPARGRPDIPHMLPLRNRSCSPPHCRFQPLQAGTNLSSREGDPSPVAGSSRLIDRLPLQSHPSTPTPIGPISIDQVAAADRPVTRFLVIWNLPAEYVWNDVVFFIQEAIGQLQPRLLLTKVCRTNQRSGDQAFWLSFGSPTMASSFRGVVVGRKTTNIQCDFVDGNVFSTSSSQAADHWSPVQGFGDDVVPDAPFLPPAAWQLAGPTLAERLDPQKNHRRTHRSKKKPKLGQSSSTSGPNGGDISDA
ncbi:hypothetical protein GALMADRAFT_148730 [Galerina marginata CBS 339.88]|uniref:Uncharacterized protein n=1 Tax=Galerina marginata (strain CBS 339.88) TaxID=685588 RepID=A0A067S3K4_GALM3|nr:hypothetical protein GALMADRAFT_148730 [Galerina marginata CBS 339.88]